MKTIFHENFFYKTYTYQWNANLSIIHLKIQDLKLKSIKFSVLKFNCLSAKYVNINNFTWDSVWLFRDQQEQVWRCVKTLSQHQWMPPKSCPTSTKNFHRVHISQIPQNNARWKLFCKFGEWKYNPYWDITLETSHDTNYVPNKHLDFSKHGPYAMPSKMISWSSYPASFKNQTEILIELLY